MKSFVMLSFTLLMFLSSWSCSAQTDKKVTKSNASTKVEAYYFHFSARCVTCKAIEAEAKADIENLYDGKVSFKSINLDEDSSKALADKLQIEGQTLLIVKGDTKINITNEGFLYARNNPEKFKTVIREKIDPLL